MKVRQWTKLGEHWPAGPKPVSKQITAQVHNQHRTCNRFCFSMILCASGNREIAMN